MSFFFFNNGNLLKIQYRALYPSAYQHMNYLWSMSSIALPSFAELFSAPCMAATLFQFAG